MLEHAQQLRGLPLDSHIVDVVFSFLIDCISQEQASGTAVIRQELLDHKSDFAAV